MNIMNSFLSARAWTRRKNAITCNVWCFLADFGQMLVFPKAMWFMVKSLFYAVSFFLRFFLSLFIEIKINTSEDRLAQII